MSYQDFTLYHATKQQYAQGDRIVAGTSTPYYLDAVGLIESHRPGGYPSRKQCVFAMDTAEAAYTFLEENRVWMLRPFQ
ncbi:MAG TPA: hypothetical protein VGN46_14405 [Luteibacter sp.]|jgi:hypothetical protein|uniref:hypothetical protein n=1 Tax=Luteibacter sp. TaxID=1886636 RepID=UPI002F4220D1